MLARSIESFSTTPEQIKQMTMALERAAKAHKSGNYGAYVDAAHAVRVSLRKMCDNEPLRRCAMLIEDQCLPARNQLFKEQKHRAMDLAYNTKILKAIKSGDPKIAETTARNYYLELRDLNLLSTEK
jgi:DNA-binding FadR family transcriptional regulator